MSRMKVELRELPIRVAIVTCTIASAACAPLTPGQPLPGEPLRPMGAVRGMLRFAEGQPVDTAVGPVVVMLAPIDSTRARNRPIQQFSLASRTDRFDPGFTTVAKGDFIVFVNDGAVSHRLFSTSLGPDVQIPVGPSGSSPPQRVEQRGELSFFCSLHPDEHFSVLVTGDVFSAVVDADGHFYIAPIPDGSYRLSIWSRRVEVPIRTMQVAGPAVVETIVLDPNLIRR